MKGTMMVSHNDIQIGDKVLVQWRYLTIAPHWSFSQLRLYDTLESMDCEFEVIDIADGIAHAKTNFKRGIDAMRFKFPIQSLHKAKY